MARIYVHSKLENKLEKTCDLFDGNGILSNRKITYYDGALVKVDYSHHEVTLFRKDLDHCLQLKFDSKKETNGFYYIGSDKIVLSVETVFLKCTDEQICVEYKLKNANEIFGYFIFKLRFEGYNDSKR